jgi:hypothetical protein
MLPHVLPHAYAHQRCPANRTLSSTLETSTSGSSYRLGNLVSAWWFSRQRWPDAWFTEVEAKSAGGGEHSQLNFLRGRQNCGGACFGAWLAGPAAGMSTVTALSTKCLRDIEERWIDERIMHQFFITPHLIYSSDIMFTACGGAVVRTFGADLRRMLNLYLRTPWAFASLRTSGMREGRETSSASPALCAVHYRVGDYLSLRGGNRSAISPRSVAAAVASFNPPPKIIVLMDGGVEWLSTSSDDPSAASVTARSRRMIQRLREALFATVVAGTRIVGPQRGSPDEDFVQLVHAPMLVIAGGSFGLAAAVAGTGARRDTPMLGSQRSALNRHQEHRAQQVRLPACGHHLDVFSTSRHALGRDRERDADAGTTATLPQGWLEYEYSLVSV